MLFCGLLVCCSPVFGQAPRFIVDDDEYEAKVVEGATRLLREGKLHTVEALAKPSAPRKHALKPTALSDSRAEAPDMYNRLRESTFAIGIFYKCPDCNQWEFQGGSGFVAEEDGVLCTCRHVVLGKKDDPKPSYLVAADSAGRVFPVESILASDSESDTCLVKIRANGLKPLPLRAGIRTGERVYCVSHPGGYYFMFSQGMVARLVRTRNEVLDDHGSTNGVMSRPILLLNITAEFAPGSSGAPIVDEAGNVVGQVASIADAGEVDSEEKDQPRSPSVPVRFGTAAEEILRLAPPRVEKFRPKEITGAPAAAHR